MTVKKGEGLVSRNESLASRVEVADSPWNSEQRHRQVGEEQKLRERA
jgi:hypothetical protein